MKIYGIDLDTTNSCISIIDNGLEKVIENEEGSNITPSVVALKDGELIIGSAAKRHLELNSNTCISVKRLIGTDKKVTLEGKEYKPEFISAKILDHLVKFANKKMNQEIKDVVITVPAYFSDAQRSSTKIAGEIAGLNVLRVLNEPTAGAIAYKINEGSNKKILAFDLGGGTFDISILEINDKDYEVIATGGDNSLGGDDWDNLIVKKIDTFCKKELKLDDNFIKSKNSQIRFKVAAEAAKINLSQSKEVQVNIPFIAMNESGPQHVNFKYTRYDFEKDSKELMKKVESVF